MGSITLPSGVEVAEGPVLVIPRIGVVMPVGDLTPAEVQALRDDVASVMDMGIGDLANVDDSARQDGYVLVYDDNTDTYISTAAPRGVQDVWSAAYIPDPQPRELQFWAPLYLGPHPSNPEITRVHLSLGSTGTSSTVARNDHTHPPTLTGRLAFNKGGAVLGAGTSDLINDSVSGLVSGVVYDVTVAGELEIVNTNNSGRILLHCRVGTTGTIQSVSRGGSGGVWTPISVHGTRMNVTGVTSLALRFWAEYESGDPTALYSGYLAYSITPRGGTS